MKLLKKFFKVKNDISDDAQEVLNSVPEEIFLSALDVYRHIYALPQTDKTGLESKNADNMQKVWQVLSAISSSGLAGLSSETKSEMVRLLPESPVFFDDLLRILIEHHDDEVEAKKLFEMHPELHKAIPEQFDNNRQVIEVLIEYVKEFRWSLEDFVNKYEGDFSN